MVEKQSEIGRDAQLAMLLRHKWRDEIEKAVDEVKLGVVQGRKRTITDKRRFSQREFRPNFGGYLNSNRRLFPSSQGMLISWLSRPAWAMIGL